MISHLPDGAIRITLPPDHELIVALNEWKAGGAPVEIEIEDELYSLLPVDGYANRYWVARKR